MAREIRDLTEVIDKIRSYHQELKPYEWPEIYEVWTDGTITKELSPTFYSRTRQMREVISHGEPGRGVPSDCLFPKFGRSRVAVFSLGWAKEVQELINSVCSLTAVEMHEIELQKIGGNPAVQLKILGKTGNQYLYLTKEETYQLAASLASAIREFEQEKERD